MPFITITVEGLNETVTGIDHAVKFVLPNIKKDVLEQTANFMVGELQRNAHVITGNMRNSVRSQMVTDSQYLVEVGAPYAIYENKRPGSKAGYGPHNFADRAEQATRDKFGSIVQSAYTNGFSSL